MLSVSLVTNDGCYGGYYLLVWSTMPDCAGMFAPKGFISEVNKPFVG
jgi:hypothetical protein